MSPSPTPLRNVPWVLTGTEGEVGLQALFPLLRGNGLTLDHGAGSTVRFVDDRRTEMRIGQLADAAGVSVETVRYYERRGLLTEPRRSTSGYRQYGPGDVERLAFLLRAKDLGFTLAEIGELFDAAATGSIDDVTAAVHAKLAMIDRQVDDLAATRCRLRQLVELCEHGDGAACLQLRLVAS